MSDPKVESDEPMTARRPIGLRGSGPAAAIARALTRLGISPNMISISSMGFAALAAWAFYEAGCECRAPAAILLILGALMVQLRLLANLFDGMVAVEGGKSAPSGAFWNEAPDRVSDLIICLGIGYGVGAPEWGWAAGALSILTAYIRELGRGHGLPADFCGPMAKPHRMVLITLAAIIAAIDAVWNIIPVIPTQIMIYALMIITLGCVVTALRRSYRQIAQLKARAKG